jgi:hypothetical protein
MQNLNSWQTIQRLQQLQVIADSFNEKDGVEYEVMLNVKKDSNDVMILPPDEGYNFKKDYSSQ